MKILRRGNVGLVTAQIKVDRLFAKQQNSKTNHYCK
jgi:hypothetical protein